MHKSATAARRGTGKGTRCSRRGALEFADSLRRFLESPGCFLACSALLVCPCAVSLSAEQTVSPATPSSSAQAPASLARQQAAAESGLQNPWDVRNFVATLLSQTEQLQPVLNHLDPQQWYNQKGAPTTYIVQWQTAQRQLKDVRYATTQLQARTESLSAALDLYFRLEALETTSRSLAEGAQRYADRQSADKLNELIAGNFNSRERLRDYLRDLTTSTEQNFKVADGEAQSCRAELSKQESPKKAKR